MNLKHLKKGKVIVFGDVILDKYIMGSIDRISPEAPVPVLRPSNEEIRLGGAANVALNLSSLGIKATLIGVTGKDDDCLLYTSPSPRDLSTSRMPSSA